MANVEMELGCDNAGCSYNKGWWREQNEMDGCWLEFAVAKTCGAAIRDDALKELPFPADRGLIGA